MAQKLSEMLQDSEIDYEIHPKIVAELFNIAGFRFERINKDFDAPISGKDIHVVYQILRDAAVTCPSTGVFSTARLAVETYRDPATPNLTEVAYFVKVGSEIIDAYADDQLKLHPWEQDFLSGWEKL